MTINKTLNETALTIEVEGRLDTVTAPELEKEVKGGLDSVQALTFDFSKLEYISSAGLRVMLTAQKLMKKKNGSIVIKGSSEDVLEIFEITGFSTLLDIE